MKHVNLALGILIVSSALGAKSIEQKSKNTIKEEIGSEFSIALQDCNKLTTHIAELQLKIAKLEKTLLSKTEDLIEDGPSFKKRTHKELTQTLGVLGETTKSLEKSITKIEQDQCLGRSQNS